MRNKLFVPFDHDTPSQCSKCLFLSPTAYIGFMWMLLLVVYGQRDPNAFFLNQHIRKSFSSNITASMSADDVLTWANTSLLTHLFGKYPGKWDL